MVSSSLTSQDFGNMDEFLAVAHRRKYPRGSTIIYAGEASDSIFYITKGSVTVFIEDDTGREIIVAYLNEKDFLAKWRCLATEYGQPGSNLKLNVKSPNLAIQNLLNLVSVTQACFII